jgi:hypothetical protein
MGAGKAALGANNPRLRSFFRLREKSGRAGGIRTHGLHVPNVALYQAEPQPVMNGRTEGISAWQRKQPLIFPGEKGKKAKK